MSAVPASGSDSRTMQKNPQESPREPARAWIWLTFVILLFVCVPYGFVGTYQPLVFGLPLWFLLTLSGSFLLGGFTMYVAFRHWRLAAFILDEETD